MASRRSRPRRFLLPTLLAAILAAEVTGLALARTLTAPAPAPAASPVAASVASAASAVGVDRHGTGADRALVGDGASGLAASPSSEQRTRTQELAVQSRAVDLASSVSATKEATKPKTSSKSATARPSGGGASSGAYHGTNRVWIPSLGINKSIRSFPCSRTRPPDAGVYRWGCSGRNNVYLLSHAWSTFKPLHDAYVSGRLKKGMKVVYADGSSRVRTYSVIWWKVTAPTTAASWAWAPLSSPSMTLQTCVGSKSQYRLMVRLVRVG